MTTVFNYLMNLKMAVIDKQKFSLLDLVFAIPKCFDTYLLTCLQK